ncbi:hypothetical protein [Candidatus Nitrotoga sp. 1052]|uniref:hypothetical protein n=1 Tax=Candidatus Nitrotoga sp. 1052 TaxID=2886964 RepID=UPI001EF7054F|nr:hypothetical protein [Candidatus Nitrotoga sp. 1052]
MLISSGQNPGIFIVLAQQSKINLAAIAECLLDIWRCAHMDFCPRKIMPHMEAIANKLAEASQCDKKMNPQRPFPEY